MKVSSIELREIQMPLVHFFETSFGRTTTRRIVLVRVDADGLTGWGEVTAGEEPFYSYETPETAWHILRDFLIPWTLGKSWAAPGDVAARFRPIRGHNMAKAALENALWDIAAQQQNLPLAKLVGGTLAEIPCGVSIGIQNSIEELLEKIEREVAAGYQRIKVKVKPGWDVNVLEAIRNRFPRIPLMADANSAYSLADIAHLKEFDRFYLMMIEQPLGWDDLLDHAKLQKEIATPICLDESIHSADDARKALRNRRGQDHQYQAGARGRIHRGAARCMTFAAPATFRCGAAACSSPASAAPTTSPCPRCRVSPCPGMFPPAIAIGRRTSLILR